MVLVGRFNYPGKLLGMEAAVVAISLLSTLLFGATQGIQQYYLRCLIMGIVGVIDFSVNLGLMMAIQLQGAIIVFYIFKTIMLLSAAQHCFSQVVLPALIAYMLFKVAGFVLVRVGQVGQYDYKSRADRANFTDSEEKRRNINIIVLFLCLTFMLYTSLSRQIPQLVPLVGSLSLLISIGAQLYIMSKSADLRFKLTSTSLAYNTYGILVLLTLVGKLYYDSYSYFIHSIIAYLLAYFFLSRVCIGSRSSKFDAADSMFFDASYLFKGDNGHKYYRESQDWQRMLRVLDRVTRQLLVAIYYLSFLVAMELHSLSYLIASIYLMNNYPVINAKPLKIISYIESKLNSSFSWRPKLALPIIITFYLMVTKKSSRQEYLFDEINHCAFFNWVEVTLMGLLMVSSFLSQFMAEEKKGMLLRGVQLGCPLVVLGWVIYLECLHFKMAVLGAYVLAYCMQAVRARVRSRSKGLKHN